MHQLCIMLLLTMQVVHIFFNMYNEKKQSMKRVPSKSKEVRLVFFVFILIQIFSACHMSREKEVPLNKLKLHFFSEQEGVCYGFEKKEDRLTLASYNLSSCKLNYFGDLKDYYMSSLMCSHVMDGNIFFAYSSKHDELLFEIHLAVLTRGKPIQIKNIGYSSSPLVYITGDDENMILYYISENGESMVSIYNSETGECRPVLEGSEEKFIFQVSYNCQDGLIYVIEGPAYIEPEEVNVKICSYSFDGELISAYQGSRDLNDICNTYISYMKADGDIVYVENFSGETMLLRLEPNKLRSIVKTEGELTLVRSSYDGIRYFYRYLSESIVEFDVEDELMTEFSTEIPSISSVLECQDFFMVWSLETRDIGLIKKPLQK